MHYSKDILKILLFLAGVFVNFFTVKAQETPKTFSPEELRYDLKVFKTTLLEAHPKLYSYISEEKFDSLLQEAANQLEAPQPEEAFYKIIAKITSAIRNAHTWAITSDKHNADALVFPLKLKPVKDQVFSIADYTQSTGSFSPVRILAINGQLIEQIITRMTPYYPMDGFINRFHSIVEDFSRPQVFNALEQKSDSFDVKAINQAGDTLRLSFPAIPYQEFEAQKALRSGTPWHLKIIKNPKVAIISIAHFLSKDVKTNAGRLKFHRFLKNAFHQIRQQQIKNIIFDVRNNQGGYLENAALLYSYITLSPFSVAKKVEIRLKNPPTYRQYTNYGKPHQFKSSQLSSMDAKDYLLLKHISLAKNKPHNNNFDGNVFVIINERTNSAASIFAGLVKRENRGTIIGAENRNNYKSFTSGTPLLLTLPNTKIKVAIPLRAMTFNETIDSGRGIIPDHPVIKTPKALYSESDEMLDAALQLILQSQN